MVISDKKTRNRLIITNLLLLCSNLLLFLTIWLKNTYAQVSIDQILYQIQTPADGAQRNLIGSAILWVGGGGIVLTLLEMALYSFVSGVFPRRLPYNRRYLAYCRTKTCRCIRKTGIAISLALLTATLLFTCWKLGVFSYIVAIAEESDFIEDHYTDPADTALIFPQEKRNLIYIFLESMENTFSDPSAGGPITDDFIPELTALAKENVSFSNTSGTGGAYMYTGATWTAAAMVTQTSGMIVKVPLTADTYSGENGYMPGIVSLGELLEAEGYHQALLLGSDAAFASRDSYFTEHGNYEIIDINALKEAGRLPEDYHEWWGFEDQKLFQYAKEELTRLSEKDQLFNLTMLTADTHFPDGYLCPLCREEYDGQYPNVLSCSSRQIGEFISWIQEQPFYENTTIVLSGDHLTMDPAFLTDIDPEYTRTIYNCIINAPVAPLQEKNRKFSTFDMFPTTLAALGVVIKGDRLGLGTNLFSDTPTLTERYGYTQLDEELQKSSAFYDAKFLKLGKR